MFQGIMPGCAIGPFILEMMAKEKTGLLVAKRDDVVKKIMFSKGRLLGENSTLIDDRLGEVIYKKGLLTAEQFIDTVGKVTPQLKFGALLVQAGYFTPLELWDALRDQAKEIIFSLFLEEKIEVSFLEEEVSSKGEILLSWEIKPLLEEALSLKLKISSFEDLARKNSNLSLQRVAVENMENDFDKDFVSLIEDNNNFNHVVDVASRLTPQYTVRALYHLFAQGILMDTFSFTRKFVPESSYQTLKNTVESLNYMFMELKFAAQKEQIYDWNFIIRWTYPLLKKNFGQGFFISGEEGFLFENILRSCVAQRVAQEQAHQKGYSYWTDSFVKFVDEALYEVLLYIFFVLLNRNFSYQEFSRVKQVLDDLLLTDL